MRVRPGRADRGFPGGISLLYALIGTLLLAAATVVVGGIGRAVPAGRWTAPSPGR